MKSFTLFLASVLATGVSMAAPVLPGGSGSICTVIAGGGSSNFTICEDLTTENGLPSGASCAAGGAASGVGIDDANIPAGSDAYDMAGLVFVDNVQLGGDMAVSSNRVTFGTQVLSGLNVQSIMDVLTTEATLRHFVSFQNPTAAAITVQLDYASNFGSDSNTQVDGTSSGDMVFGTGDTWVVTSDGSDGDPANTTVFGDSGTMVPLTGASVTVFDCSDEDGLLGTFSLTVPAGATVAMVFFHRLSDTASNAVAAGGDFTMIAAASPLLAGLSPTELAQVVNLGAGGGVLGGAALAVPTISDPALILLILSLIAMAWMALRRQHR